MHTFHTQRRVEFADTDMEGIVHFARFLVYMETAEHQFLEAAGTSVVSEQDGRRIGWPRVAVACQYERPARFGDTLEIEVRVARKGRRSMTYGFSFRRDGELLARGQTTAVCCELADGALRSIEIPPAIADKLEQAPGEP
jgi:YbgC/YbaW family acyl-CoA thioester hydrolase